MRNFNSLAHRVHGNWRYTLNVIFNEEDIIYLYHLFVQTRFSSLCIGKDETVSQHELLFMFAVMCWQRVSTPPLCRFSHLSTWTAYTNIHMPTLVW